MHSCDSNYKITQVQQKLQHQKAEIYCILMGIQTHQKFQVLQIDLF